MESSPSLIHAKAARYYNSASFGINVILRCHVDKDTMSIDQVHMDQISCQSDDSVVYYFSFPRIGIAIALKPGNFLLFNPQEPHYISSTATKATMFIPFHCI
jgi:hypothetical protein